MIYAEHQRQISSQDSLKHIWRLCRQAPHLKPLAFEALLQTPVLCPVRLLPGESFGSGRRPLGDPVLMLNPALGIPALAALVLSNGKYSDSRIAPLPIHTYRYPQGRDLVAQLLRETGHAMAVDPGTPHALYFGHGEMSAWLAAWESAQPAPSHFEPADCEFRLASGHSPHLLDRLAALLSMCNEVVRAYLCRARPKQSQGAWQLAVLVERADGAVLQRIRQALPLLAEGLTANDAPRYVFKFERSAAFMRDAVAFGPVYDRAMPLLPAYATRADTFRHAMRTSVSAGYCWVLCRNFLPWMDIAVKASSPHMAEDRIWLGPADADMQWKDAEASLPKTMTPQNSRHYGPFEMMTSAGFSMASWSKDQRRLAERQYGPFDHVIEVVSPAAGLAGA